MNRSVLCIDGGVCDVTRKGIKLRIDGCACAHFMEGLCTSVFFAAECGPQSGAFDMVVVERPIIRGNNTPNPQDIVDLAWDSAALAYSLGAPVRTYTPSQWKGGIPKPAFHRRMWPHLSAAEKRLLPPETEAVIEAACRKGAADRWSKSGADYYPRGFRAHNLLDAIGIGMYEHGRFDIRKDTPDESAYDQAVARRAGALLQGRTPGRDRPRPKAKRPQGRCSAARLRGSAAR